MVKSGPVSFGTMFLNCDEFLEEILLANLAHLQPFHTNLAASNNLCNKICLSNLSRFNGNENPMKTVLDLLT